MKLYKCKTCGNTVAVLGTQKAPLFCCGAEMSPLVANTMEASLEKHIPVQDSDNLIQVGSTLHPMDEKHFISWVLLKDSKNDLFLIKELNLNEKPSFNPNDFKADELISYCNLHGLWSNKKTK